MNFERELEFLCNVLKKCKINTSQRSVYDTISVMLDSWLANVLGVDLNTGATIEKAVGGVEKTTKYIFTNELDFKYTIFKLPVISQNNLFIIGPYLSSPLSSSKVLEIGERLGLTPNTQRILKEYYASLPIVSENDKIHTIIDSFCEYIWQTESFTIVEINEQDAFSSLELISRSDDFDDLLADMEMMEKRYEFENELIHAVVTGRQHKEKELSSVFNEQLFEKRLQDSLRNAKNYCVIMNTLLRKAAEQGGVHPYYIDKTSSKFASKIEQTPDVVLIPELMQQMFSSYCRLVRRHSIKQYSPIVKKAILIIDSDISAELSLNIIATKQGVSSGYLATLFKKETGKTVSEFIRERRVSHAIYLLSSTNLQVQTVAMHCGIMDVQYFSKLFKKETGKTPGVYRKLIK